MIRIPITAFNIAGHLREAIKIRGPVRPLPCILGGYFKRKNEHQRRQVLIAGTNINANETPVPPTRCILESGKF